jgi:glycerophosphoryl diester phosphodiesterase
LSFGPSRRLPAGLALVSLLAISATSPVQATTDDERPRASAPSVAVRGRLRTDSIPLRVRWPEATDAEPSSGIATYQVQQRTMSGGSWGGWHTVARTASRALTRYARAGTHQFRVRARDRAGNWSTWKAGTQFILRDPQAGGAVDFGGHWRSRRATVYYEGSTRLSTDRGASAEHTFVGSQVAWVASRGPKRGRARVYVDGVRRATVDLRAASRRERRIVFSRRWADSALHTIRIQVTGSRVDLDAFVTLVTADSPPAGTPPKIVAHRGDTNDADGYPENSLGAVAQAAARGADMVEVDVRWSADGTPWLNHDAFVGRTTNGTGSVASLTDAALSRLVVNGGFGYRAGRHGTSIRLARLEEVLEALAGSDTGIRVDAKDDRGARLVRFLADHGWPLTAARTEVAVHSRAAADAIRALGTGVRIIAGDDVRYSPDQFDGWTVAYGDASASLFDGLGGYASFYSRIADRDDADRVLDALAWGVDAITVNDLPSALAVRDSMGD